MEKFLKNNCCTLVFLTIFTIFCPILASQKQLVTLSFDSLFPKTWYQKGLEASVMVWHILADAVNNNDISNVVFDVLIGKLAFAQFCVNRMQYEGVVCLPEDTAYFGAVLNKIKELVEVFGINDFNEDFILCIYDVITKIQEKLSI